MTKLWLPPGTDPPTPRRVDSPAGGRRWKFNVDEARTLRDAGMIEPGGRVCYFAADSGEWMLRAIVGQHPTSRLWHLSVAHPDRDPSWAELSDARYKLCPNEAVMVMILPPKEQYVNVHQHCFHLHEVPEAEETARGDR